MKCNSTHRSIEDLQRRFKTDCLRAEHLGLKCTGVNHFNILWCSYYTRDLPIGLTLRADAVFQLRKLYDALAIYNPCLLTSKWHKTKHSLPQQ